MKVVFDAQIFSLQYYGGISRYFVELARAMKEATLFQPEIIAPWFINEYLNDPENKDLQVKPLLNKALFKNHFFDFSTQLTSFFTEWYLKNNAVDILHETYYSFGHIRTFKARRVITIHDMIYELYPDGLPGVRELIEMKKASIMRADHIIAISENTRKDLVAIYPETQDRISVVHHGVRVQTQNNEINPIKKPYLLFVGQRAGYKNFAGFLELFYSNSLLRSQYLLVCFGGGAFSDEELEQIRNRKLAEKVVYLTGADHFLQKIYQGAELFVYPSLYEGFGMPVLEAMGNGCPVVCAATSSLPEVGGLAACYFDPAVSNSLELAVLSVLTNQQKRTAMIQEGRKHALTFTWKRCAEETCNVYSQL